MIQRYADDNRPRIQFIRGIPGSGKTTAAKKYPCLHLELDMFCCRNGAYRWGEKRDGEANEWMMEMLENALKRGIDIVISGVMANPFAFIGRAVKASLTHSYDVWIQDLYTNHGNVHEVREEDMRNFREAFIQVGDTRFIQGILSHCNGEDDRLDTSVAIDQRVRYGLMPNKYPNIPETDGL